MKAFVNVKYLLFSIFSLLININAFSQQNNGINYQGIARRADGNPLIEQTISLKLSIKEGSVNGINSYSEIRQVKTNAFGLFNVVIGGAGSTSQTGNLTDVDWKTGNKFLQVEIDPNGGSNFITLGISQLQSVPFAIHAQQAAPIGTAKGDLSGNYPNPTVNKLQGKEISAQMPNVGQILKWDGKAWTPSEDLSGTGVQGPKGDKGDPGTNGTNGTNGAPGLKGDKGDPGTNGTNGAPGLKGDKGDPGTNGVPGLKGDKGDPGTNGTNGTNGAPGLKGDKGDPGTNGTNGAPGLKGDKGDPGTNGTNGAPGLKGDKGDPGTNGTDGAPGLKGDKGDPGTNGIDGAPGLKGDKGDPGIDGKTILNGIINPTITDGTDGDFYINTLNYEFFGPKSGGIWPKSISLKNGSGDFVNLTTDQTINGLKNFNSNQGFLATGNINQGDTLLLGAGSRMMWYPQKAAFRVGLVDGTQWNHYRTGYYSFASGENTIASGDYSTAFGNSTKASGQSAFAMGGGAEAIGDYSAAFGGGSKALGNGSFAAGSGTQANNPGAVAFGGGARAMGDYSFAAGAGTQANGPTSVAFGAGTNASGSSAFAMGSGTIASGLHAVAFGQGAKSSGDGSFSAGLSTEASNIGAVAFGAGSKAMGDFSFAAGAGAQTSGPTSVALGAGTNASGMSSFAMGSGAIASGTNSVALGSGTEASEAGSVALGVGTKANGASAFAMGYATNAPSFGEIALGTFNTIYTPSSNVTNVATDRLFSLGNGNDANNPSDALFVLKNGNTTINGTLTAAGLSYPSNDGTNGQVLSTDGKGNLNWQTIGGSSPMFNFATGAIPFSDGNLGLESNSDFKWDNQKGSLNIISKNNSNLEIPSLRVYPNPIEPTMPTWMRIGDDGIGAEFGISGGNDQFFTGTVQGDAVIKGFSSSDNKKLFIGAGLNSPANIILSPNGETSIGGTTFSPYPGLPNQVLTTDGSGYAYWDYPMGGTGSGSSNFVDLSNDQDIYGVKNFVSDLKVNNLTVGRGSGQSSSNTALGINAIQNNSTGSNLVAIGRNALSQNTIGIFNSAVGNSALGSNTEGIGNTAFGSASLILNTTGGNNTAIGKFTSYTNISGNGITTIGAYADVAQDGITNSTAIGYGAVINSNNTVQLGNTYVSSVKTSGKITSGDITFPNTDGTAGQILTTDGSGNVSWGNQSISGGRFVDLSTDQSINGNKTFTNDLIVNGLKLGHGAGNWTDNFTLGSNSMSKITDGTYNSGLGINSLSENTTGVANTAIGYNSLKMNSIGIYNTAMGESALMNSVESNYNTAIGASALLRNTQGNWNIGIGYRANEFNTIGTQNIAIGFESGVISNNLTNTISIGHQAKARANNQAAIGTALINEVLMGEGLAVVKGGNYISSSDARLKENIRTLNYGLKEILLLKPVNFSWKRNSMEDIGFIAQEVKKVIPELVYGIEGDLAKNETLAVNYSQMVSVLTKAIQEQQSQIEELKQSKTEQKQQIEELKILINQLLEKIK